MSMTETDSATMNATELRACLDALGWSQGWLADYLGINPVTVQRWAQDKAPIPAHVAAWIRARAGHARLFPFPVGWEDGPI